MSDLTQLDSNQLFERAKKVAPGGVHSPVRSFKGMDRPPIFFKKATGAYLWSTENVKYIDFCQSFGPLILGHLDPDVKTKVHEMIDTAWSFGATEPYSLMLAEFIQSNLPWMQKMRFVSSGTEAVMSALRVARAATGRKYVLKFSGCYHGHVDALLVQAGSGLAGVAAASSAGVSEATAQETLVCNLDNLDELKKIFADFGSEISAVIVEPLPANYGLLIQRKEFLQDIARLAKTHGSLLIFDEVISGFRVALGGMAERLGIIPDLVTYGKIMGGGFPVGCYGGRADLMDLVAPLGPVYQAGTLSANPVGMIAGLTTLKKMKDLGGWQILEKRTEKFAADLNAGFASLGLAMHVDTYASLFWIREKGPGGTQALRSLEQIPASQSESFKKLFLATLKEGVYLAPNAYEVGFVSMAHTETILKEASDKILAAARSLRE
jgi:glutamate-1-semialdehyde 2,1-aminomutase